MTRFFTSPVVSSLLLAGANADFQMRFRLCRENKDGTTKVVKAADSNGHMYIGTDQSELSTETLYKVPLNLEGNTAKLGRVMEVTIIGHDYTPETQTLNALFDERNVLCLEDMIAVRSDGEEINMVQIDNLAVQPVDWVAATPGYKIKYFTNSCLRDNRRLAKTDAFLLTCASEKTYYFKYDECANDEDNRCDPNATCYDQDNGYYCKCNVGYVETQFAGMVSFDGLEAGCEVGVEDNFITGNGEEAEFDFDDCGVNMSCMVNIENCEPGDPGCALVAWKVEDDELCVTMVSSGEDKYVGFGIAPEDTMTDADLTFCQDRDEGLGVEPALGQPGGNGEPLTVGIEDGLDPSTVRTSRDGDLFICSFCKPLTVEKNGNEYDLNTDTEWNILISKGDMNGDDPVYHGISDENGNAVASPTLEISAEADPVCINCKTDTEDSYVPGTQGDENIDLAECGVTVNCLTNMDKCVEQPEDLDCVFAKWTVDDEKMCVTLQGKTQISQDRYVGIAISNGRSMDDSDITFCQERGTGLGVEAGLGGDMNGRPNTGVGTDSIIEGSVFVNPLGVRDHGDKFVCTFCRPLTVDKDGQETTLDDTSEWNLLLSNGAMDGDKPLYHGPSSEKGNAVSTTKPLVLHKDTDPVFLVGGSPDPEDNFIEGDGEPDVDFDGCGVTINCMANIENCRLGDPECALVTWEVEDDKLCVTMSGTGGEDKYVGFGIAPGDTMTAADLTFCQDRGENGIGVQSAMGGAENGRPRTDGIQDGLYPDTVKSSRDGDIFSCSFCKPLTVEKGGETYTMDPTTEWNILISKGEMNGNEPDYHGISTENGNAVASPTPLEISKENEEKVFINGHVPDDDFVEGTTDSELAFDLGECGVTVSCMTNMEDCTPENPDCVFAKWTTTDEEMCVTLSGRSSGTNSYIGFAVSTNRNMEDADITMCQERGEGNIGVEAGVGGSPGGRPNTNGLGTGSFIEDSVTVNRIGDQYLCSYCRPLVVEKDGQTYRLDETTEWNLLLSNGKMDGDIPEYHGPSYEDGNAVSSEHKIVIHKDEPNIFIVGDSFKNSKQQRFETCAITYADDVYKVPSSGFIGSYYRDSDVTTECEWDCQYDRECNTYFVFVFRLTGSSGTTDKWACYKNSHSHLKGPNLTEAPVSPVLGSYTSVQLWEGKMVDVHQCPNRDCPPGRSKGIDAYGNPDYTQTRHCFPTKSAASIGRCNNDDGEAVMQIRLKRELYYTAPSGFTLSADGQFYEKEYAHGSLTKSLTDDGQFLNMTTEVKIYGYGGRGADAVIVYTDVGVCMRFTCLYSMEDQITQENTSVRGYDTVATRMRVGEIKYELKIKDDSLTIGETVEFTITPKSLDFVYAQAFECLIKHEENTGEKDSTGNDIVHDRTAAILGDGNGAYCRNRYVNFEFVSGQGGKGVMEYSYTAFKWATGVDRKNEEDQKLVCKIHVSLDDFGNVDAPHC